jgi:hypothetical protein
VLQPQNNKKLGIRIFAVVALVFLGVCILAYVITGDQGIEERFAKAVGLPGESDAGDSGILGFTLEGNHLSYLIILAVILLATAIIYVKFKV